MFTDLYNRAAADTQVRRSEYRHKHLAKALGVDYATLSYWLHKKR